MCRDRASGTSSCHPLAVQTIRLVAQLRPTAVFPPLRFPGITVMGERFTFHLIGDTSVGSCGLDSRFRFSGARQSVSGNPRFLSASPTRKADL